MIRIGLVDLDTSHPHAFTTILRTMPGITVSALWDGHDVWPAGYDAQFAREHDIPVVCSRLEEMPGLVDAAMIHGTNWNSHLEKATVFMKSKIPVLIDKPVVGTVRDCDALLDLHAKHGALVYGGSSLRCVEAVTALRETIGPRERLSSIAASGPGDFFSYGIHTTEMLQGCAGLGIRSVKVVTEGRAPVFALTYRDGMVAFLHLQMQFHEWSLSAYTDHGLRTATVVVENNDVDPLYRPFLNNFVALLNGNTVDYALAGPVEAVRVHIAAKMSIEKGREVVLDDLPADAGFDGAVFVAEYAASKRTQVPAPQR